MEPKDYLRQMIDNTIDGDSEAAEQSFKNYIVPKTIEVLGITTNSQAKDAEPAEKTDDVAKDAEVADAGEADDVVEPTEKSDEAE